MCQDFAQILRLQASLTETQEELELVLKSKAELQAEVRSLTEKCFELRKVISDTESRLAEQSQLAARLRDDNNHYEIIQNQLKSELQVQIGLRSVATQNADESLKKLQLAEDEVANYKTDFKLLKALNDLLKEEFQRNDEERVASEESVSKLRDDSSRAQAQDEELQSGISPQRLS